MALPISPTPVLEGEDARKFLERVERDLKKPLGLVPTPKLKVAIKAVMKEAKNG
jgi:hypothetical protein